MAKKKKEDPLDYVTIPGLNIDPEIKKNIFALLILLLAIVAALGLFSAGGLVGSYLNQGTSWAFGVGRFLTPLALLAWAAFIFFKEKLEIRAANYVGLIFLVLSIQGFLQLIISPVEWEQVLAAGAGGGQVGFGVALGLLKAIGPVAAFVAIIIIFTVGLMFTLNATLAHLLAKGSGPAKFFLHPFSFLWHKLRGEKQEEKEEAEEANEEENEEEENNEEEAEEENEEENEEEEEDENDDEDPSASSGQENDNEEVHKPVMMAARPAAKAKEAEVLNIWKPSGVDIDLPLDLLSKKIGKPVANDTKIGKEKIRNTLEQFGIKADMADVCVGPTVTQYTLKPSEGVKLSRIIDLSSNLALSLAAHPIRIEAPIPGKSLVGIEVPNITIATVGLREVLTSPEYGSRGSNMMISLGKDVAGKSWLANLTKMPHLLVAGQTGSGKSVMLNTIIVSLLYENNPDDLRFIMVDPKRVELTMYNGIPHLLTPVITEVAKTVNALKWCLNELDRRLKLLEQAKKRDISSYNQSAKQRLPYIVFIIDELADLMLVAGKEVETSIVRLAQLARAVGIHLVLATQRPSVNVITGTIKANMPARIAFAVASQIDSRTILDGPGAEKLLGKGDMLFSDPSMSKPKRIQGAFVSEQEVKRIVNYIKGQSDGADYLDGVTERQKVQGAAGVGMDGSSDDDDEITNLAVETILQTGRVSTTYLQRKLSIGYPRAAKLIDQLEEMGVIGAAQGSKPREILVTADQWEEMKYGQPASAPIHNQKESKAPAEYLPADSESEEDEEDPSTGSGQREIVVPKKKKKVVEEEEEENEDEEESEEDGANFFNEEAIEDDDENNEEDAEEENDEEESEEEEESKPKKSKVDFDKYFSR